jgi:hypothetical protein
MMVSPPLPSPLEQFIPSGKRTTSAVIGRVYFKGIIVLENFVCVFHGLGFIYTKGNQLGVVIIVSADDGEFRCLRLLNSRIAALAAYLTIGLHSECKRDHAKRRSQGDVIVIMISPFFKVRFS